MDLVTMVYSLSNTKLFILIFIVLSCISFTCLLIVEKFLPSKLRYNENNSVEYVGATIGVIYAVLAGFILFYVMDNFQKAGEITRNESASAAKIFRNAVRLPLDEEQKIKMAMRSYVTSVITIEWPLISQEKTANAGEGILDKLMLDLIQYRAVNDQDLNALQDIYNELNELYKNRDARIDLTMAALPSDLWILIIISTVLTLLVKSLSGMQLSLHLRLHITLQTVVTLILTTILFLIIVLDRPFRGHFSITSAPFEEVLMDMKKQA